MEALEQALLLALQGQALEALTQRVGNAMDAANSKPLPLALQGMELAMPTREVQPGGGQPDVSQSSSQQLLLKLPDVDLTNHPVAHDSNSPAVGNAGRSVPNNSMLGITGMPYAGRADAAGNDPNAAAHRQPKARKMSQESHRTPLSLPKSPPYSERCGSICVSVDRFAHCALYAC